MLPKYDIIIYMNFLEFLTERFDSKKEKNIGKISCSRLDLPDVLTGLLQKMGMANPSSLAVKSNKAVTIIRKDDKYILILNTYNPPIALSWTGTIPLNQLTEVIDNLATQKKKIGFINFVSVDGMSSFQMGLG